MRGEQQHPLLTAIVRPCSERFTLNTPKYSVKTEQIAHIPGKRHLFLTHRHRLIVEKRVIPALLRKRHTFCRVYVEGRTGTLYLRERRGGSALCLVCGALRVSGSVVCFVFCLLCVSGLRCACGALCTASCLGLGCFWFATCVLGVFVMRFGSPYTYWFACTGCCVWCDAYLICGALGFRYTCRVRYATGFLYAIGLMSSVYAVLCI